MPLPLDGHDTGGHRLPAHLGIAAGSLASSTSTSTLNSIPTNPTRDDYYPTNAPTSSATLNSILTTTTTSTIPQKRKQSGAGLGIYGYEGPMLNASPAGGVINQHHHHLHPQNVASPRLPTTPIVPPPPPFHSAATLTPSHPPPNSNVSPDSSNDGIDCMCGFTLDDGYSIQCDQCERWCHAVCFGISKEENNVPDVWLCWVCQPRPNAMREAAVRTQSERLLLFGGPGAGLGFGPGGGLLFDEDGREGKRGRKLSPGHDRKGRRGSNAAIDGGGGKRRRRASVAQPGALPNITSNLSTSLNGASGTGVGAAEAGGSAGEDQHVDIDEPWKDTYVHISEDIIPSDETRYRLRKQAMNWRGITAVSTPPSSAPPPPVTVKELPPQTTYNPLLTLNSNPSVLPPTYGLHTTAPIPSEKLITPYTSSITPSTSYLSDPLNAYAHLGMPKPFVHLLGPPLDVALDSRLVGNYGRFVRSGCRPNAVLRPVLCNKARGDEDKENRDHAQQEEDGRTLAFGVFALRDLKAGEEVVLGWEWDDGNAVHCLPALLSTPHMFPADRFHLASLNSTSTFSSPNVPSHSSTPPFQSIPTPEFTPNLSTSSKRSPHEISHLRAQISNILHALASTFTTCACGGRARDCVLTQMATFVDGPQEAEQVYQRNNSNSYREKEVDLGPLVGRKRGFKTRERIPNSGGIGGMEMWVDEEKGEGGSRRVNGVHSAHDASSANGAKTKHVNGHGARAMGPPPVPANRRSKSPSVTQQRQEKHLSTPVEVQKSRKGKEKAVVEDEDVDTEDGSRLRSDSLSSTKTIKPPSPPTTLLAPPEVHSTRRTRSQTSRPPPPDPPPVPPDPEEQKKDETKMPPKMRKRWMHHEAERLMKDREEREVGAGEERVGLGIRIEVDAPTSPGSDSSTAPPPAPPTAAIAAPASPPRSQSPPETSPPPQSAPRASISSLTTLLTPTATPTLPTPSSTSPTQSIPPPTSTPSAVVANTAFPSPSLASFANLSLLSPALANGPQTPSIAQPSQLLKVLGKEKVAGYPFPPGRAESPSPPSRFTQGWTPLKRMDSLDKAGVEDAQADGEKPPQPLEKVVVTQKGDSDSSIASSSANTPQPEMPIQRAEDSKVAEDVEMEDGEEPEKAEEIGEASAEAGEVQSELDQDHDRARSPLEEVLPVAPIEEVAAAPPIEEIPPAPPIQAVQPEPEEDTSMKVDEPSKKSPTPSFPVRRSPTPPLPSESAPAGGDMSALPEALKGSEEPSPTITITEPAPRSASPLRSTTNSVQPSPSTVLSSLPSPSPSPAPGAKASSSQVEAPSAASAPQQKVKMSLKDFAMRKRKQKEKEEAELVKTKTKDKEGGGEKSEQVKGKGKEGEDKPETASMVVDGTERSATAGKESGKDKDVDMSGASPTMSAPATSAPSAPSPTTTATPTTPAFDPKAFSEAAAAILNGQHRPQLQHLPIRHILEFEPEFPRIRGASPLVASVKAQAAARAQAQSHSRPRTPAPASGTSAASSSQSTSKVKEGKVMKAQSRPRSDVPTLSQPSAKSKEVKRQPQARAPPTLERPSSRQKTLAVLDTKEMKKEAIETSLALSTPPPSAMPGLPKDGMKVDKDVPTSTPAFPSASKSVGVKDSQTGHGKDKAEDVSGAWVASSAGLGPRPSAVLAASATTSAPHVDGASGAPGKDVVKPLASRLGPDPSAPKPPSPLPPANADPQPEREPPHARHLRSVSPMGPDMLRPDVQLTPPSLGSGFSAHSRMSSREDGEIVGDGSPPMLPRTAASPTPMSTAAGRGPPLYYPPAPASPPAPPSAKPAFGPSVVKAPYAPPSVSPSPSFSRNPPTGPSYYQRMSASRAGQPDGSTNAKAASPPATSFNGQAEPINQRGPWNTGTKIANAKSGNPFNAQPEPPKAPRALRQSMLANRGGAGGGGAGTGAGGAASPVQSTPVSDPSSLSRTPSQAQIHPSTPSTSSSVSFSNGNASQGPFAPRGPSVDRERERELPDRGRSRFGDRDKDARDGKDASREGGRDGSVGSSGAGGGGEARPSLRDRIDWDRYPRGSGSGMRRWGR